MSKKWMSSIIMYVVGDTPTLTAVKRYVDSVWNQVQTPNIFLHDDGYFLVHFHSIEDRDLVLAGGPYTFLNKPVIIKPWSTGFNFYEEILKVIPLWIKLPNLPLNFWSADSLIRIASILGVPLFADDCTTRQQRVSFARVLVEMDVTMTLPDHVWIEDELGVEFKQAIVYDWKPSYCAKCSMPGHDCSFLGKPVQKPVTKQPTKQIWVPKKQQQGQKPVPAQVATPEHQTLAVTQSGADFGWRVATKKSKNRGVPVSTSNVFDQLPKIDMQPIDVGNDVAQEEELEDIVDQDDPGDPPDT
ncbi:uncharacterized protein LOC110720205 [Chenopodium quinoa]|uniref:uncharacterized protein LOC110720205 n=1 Tax=Chenopodium quinoa TaxID=63459 RepID=UPI000B78B942|nr:uncharacterized protein LOC110720205 [Chenopodium quinoa]